MSTLYLGWFLAIARIPSIARSILTSDSMYGNIPVTSQKYAKIAKINHSLVALSG
jgi:hypothetical protein